MTILFGHPSQRSARKPLNYYYGLATLSRLAALKSCASVSDLARLLGYKPARFTHIVFKSDPALRYKKIELSKKTGGMRELNVPTPRLMRLQRELAHLLVLCEQELRNIPVGGERKESASRPKSISHGFRKNHSIATNAHPHKNKKFVFNIDLKDFFPSINFGRVRGFFISDRRFGLNKDVATAIAQTVCHNNQLPQGSPTSPIISNFIGHILDIKLSRLARKNKCYYTRYVDDLTFSTSISGFPTEIAISTNSAEPVWSAGPTLEHDIRQAGFLINPAKTRMQIRPSRQTVTGLVVNKSVNVPVELYKASRAMTFHLLMDGTYEFPYIKQSGRDKGSKPKITASIRPIEALLGYIYYVKKFRETQTQSTKPKLSKSVGPKLAGIGALRSSLLFYKYFVANPKPTIICEGKTDHIYLKFSVDRLIAAFPTFKTKNSLGKMESSIHMLKYTRPVIESLNLRGGSGDMKNFLVEYNNCLKNIKHRPFMHPVIVLIDNDEGAKDIFAVAQSIYGIEIQHSSRQNFYQLTENLYIVKTLESNLPNNFSSIESSFTDETLATKFENRTFTLENEYDVDKEYGKEIFAQRIIKANYQKIDFAGFHPLLERINSVIEHHKDPANRIRPVTEVTSSKKKAKKNRKKNLSE